MPVRTMNSSRRRFLRGVGGVALGLPVLEALESEARTARAAGKTVPAVYVVNMNGVQQAGFGNEPERFWPKALGPLTRAGLAGDSDRAVSELAEHAERLLMIRGVRLPFPGSGCSHSGGGNQVLTAARVSDNPSKNKSLAMGESVDNHIARRLGVEPLALYAGPKGGYINDHVSFRGPKELRVAENNPWLAYTRLIGMAGAATEPALVQRLASRRASVNDLVRAEMQELLARKDLSASDRKRLDQHFASVRELEVTITRTLAPDEAMRFKSIDGRHRGNDVRLMVEKMQMDLAVFALAGGYTQIVFLQIGDGTDGMTYTVNGVTLPRFHLVSHRASEDGKVSDGTMPGATQQHHAIDRIVMRQWKHLLDRLAATDTPTGNLLEVGYALWTNHVATGNHNYHNIPYVIAGRAGGFFKTGQYFSASGGTSPAATGNVPNNQLLNVLINAHGLRKPDGGLVDNFGDPGLPKGLLRALMA